jgi:hypothetical protein
VASLLSDDPARIELDLPTIGAKLATVSPVAEGLTSKTFSNVRSGFITAVRVSGLKPIQRPARTPLSPAWQKLIADLSGKREHIGLSRLARYASANGIEPHEINDATIDAFITAVRESSVHRKPNGLHRTVALIWNEVAQRSDLGLQAVKVPSFRLPPKRIEWTSLATAFRKEVDKYLTWCSGSDLFAADARPRALAPQTIALRRNQTPPPPHSWQAGSGQLPSGLSRTLSHPKTSNASCNSAIKWLAVTKTYSTATSQELSSGSRASG